MFRGWRKLRDRFAKALDVDVPRKIEIYTQLSTSASLSDLVYWLQLFASAGIATLGLVMNSTAVIIGAMLISPLMAPILSAGLALATGDLTLGIRSVANLFLSTLLGVGVAIILVALLPFKDLTPEILARTTPSTLDLVIALFSGAIGAIAICRDVKGVATSIPGVAIAVALMPPLCVIGFGLGYFVSLGDWKGMEIARGGGLLYLTNLVAITFTAMLVFVVLRIDRHKVRDAVRKWRDADPESQWWLSKIDKIPSLEKAREVRSFSLRLLMILIPLLIIFFPLSDSLSKLRVNFTEKQRENRTSTVARNVWKKYEEDSEGKIRSYLDELRINETDGKLTVFLRVFDNKPYTQGERTKYISLLATELKRKPEDITLHLVEIPTSEREEVSPVILATPTPLTVVQRQANYKQSIDDALGGFKLTAPAQLIDYSVTTRSSGGSTLNVFYSSSRDIEEDGKTSLRERVKERLALPNMVIIFTRIDSKAKKIAFKPNGNETLDTTNEELDAVARELNQHSNLRVRILLKSEGTNTELIAKRRKEMTRIFVEVHSISENRLVFDETDDDDVADTYQIFIRK